MNEDVIHDDVLDKELEEVKQNVGDYVLDDDMIAIDDSDVDVVDMANILNMNSEPYDIDEELDEEEYEWYQNIEMYMVCIHMFSVSLLFFIYLKYLFS